MKCKTFWSAPHGLETKFERLFKTGTLEASESYNKDLEHRKPEADCEYLGPEKQCWGGGCHCDYEFEERNCPKFKLIGENPSSG